MLATDTINFQTVDLLSENEANALRNFEANEIMDKDALAMMGDEMTEIFEAVVSQLTALEVLECIIYGSDSVRREYLVNVHGLNECKYGFDQISGEDFEWTRHFKFDSAADAFGMIAAIIKL